MYNAFTMKSKLTTFLSLVVFLFAHQTTATSSQVPINIVLSNVKSFYVQRQTGYDLFTVNMKSSHTCTDGTVDKWCSKLSAHHAGSIHNRSSCQCTCTGTFYTFISPMQKCVDVSGAVTFGGCQGYFDRQNLLAFLNHPVDLAQSSTKTFSVSNVRSCTFTGDYFVHDYSGFQSRWITNNGFFSHTTETSGNTFSIHISWRADLNRTLSGRIIKFPVTCRGASSSFTHCILLKATGPVTYSGPVNPSTSSSYPTVSSSRVGSPSSTPNPLSASSALSPLLSSVVSSTTGTLGVPQTISSFLSSTQSRTTRIPGFTTGFQSLLPINSDGTTDQRESTGIPLTSAAVVYPIEPSKTTVTVSSSSAADVGPGGKGTQTSGNDNGVLIGAAVGGAVVLGIVIIIIIVFWKRRKTWKNSEKQTKPVKKPVYGSSDNEIQLEIPKGSETMPSIAQDDQPTYQSLVIANGKRNGAAIYSSADDEYDNCTVYQSLDKQIPGTPVYQSLNKGLPEAAHTTGKPNPKVKPKAVGIPNSKANSVTGMPKPKPAATGKPSNKPSVTEEPVYNVYNVLDGPGTGHGTTAEPLYNVLEGTDSGEDYEAPNVDPLYNVLEGPDAGQDLPENGPSATQEPLYNVLEGPDVQNGPIDGQGPGNDPLYNVLEGPESSQGNHKRGPHATQEPLYNVLEGPDADNSPLVAQAPCGPSDEPLYNVLDGPDSDGPKQGAPNKALLSDGQDNPAYEQSLEFDTPYVDVQRPGTQRESVYESLRGPAQEMYESLGQSANPHSAC